MWLSELDPQINDLFLVLFTAHVVIMALANIGHHGLYFRESWYNYATVGVLWILSIEAHMQRTELIDVHSWGWIQALQSLRSIWLVDVLTASAQMRKLVHTIRLSIPQTVNIGTLMLLVYFVFGIFFMKLYGDVDLDHPNTPIRSMSHYTHFGDIFHSMQLLFQITTGHPLPWLAQVRPRPGLALLPRPFQSQHAQTTPWWLGLAGHREQPLGQHLHPDPLHLLRCLELR